MKIAVVLMSGGLLLSPGWALAQNAGGTSTDRSVKDDAVKIARGNSSGTHDTDRAIDAELRRVDRMMNICTGC